LQACLALTTLGKRIYSDDPYANIYSHDPSIMETTYKYDEYKKYADHREHAEWGRLRLQHEGRRGAALRVELYSSSWLVFVTKQGL
jgi:hypothetical protein